MACKTPNVRLAELLKEADWGGADLARAMNSLSSTRQSWVRYDRTTVAHWLTGSRPRPPGPALLVEALSRRLKRPVTAADAGLAKSYPPHTTLHRLTLDEPAAVRTLSALLRAETAINRRHSADAAYMPFAVPALKAAVGDLLTKAPHPARPEATSAMVELEDMTHTFARLFHLYGSGPVRRLLAHYLDEEVIPLLTERPGRLPLLGGASQLAHLLADMNVDATNDAAAQRYYHLSYALAHQAGNRVQAAITLRALSAQACHLGHIGYAAQLSDAAVDAGGGDAPAGTKSFLLAQQALMQARQGRPRVALSTLGTAERAHEQATSMDGPFTDYPRPALDYQRAQVFFALGEGRHVQQAFEASLHHRENGQHRALALTQARYAQTLLHNGYLEAASRYWLDFLDHYPHVRSTLARQELGVLLRCLTPHRRQRQAADVLERASLYTRSSR
ncbi:hypothetical protein AB0D14_06350 [Streptomyces sp. NPDC048484]|uniref:hypothetical protein n=1 Tax=Streptomyces sp. NPDC048484 TaxID=3155146 RepID=UPI00343B0C2F